MAKELATVQGDTSIEISQSWLLHYARVDERKFVNNNGRVGKAIHPSCLKILLTRRPRVVDLGVYHEVPLNHRSVTAWNDYHLRPACGHEDGLTGKPATLMCRNDNNAA